MAQKIGELALADLDICGPEGITQLPGA